MSELAIFGHDLFGHPIEQPSRGKVADDFVCPPFTVLSSREGWWQERKAAWIGRGIKSEVGRPDGLLPAGNGSCYGGKSTWSKPRGRITETDGESGSTSIFDPVLCELAYRWFCPPSALVLDPFAGGSVRGIVAVLLGRRYHGIELRPEQVRANFEQADLICPDAPPAWICGDARDELPNAPPADFVFSCPPYADLERYSDDPRDLSTMPWAGFLDAYRAIVAAACAQLRPDRFACFVVGDVRDNHGLYRNLPGETIRAFTDAGLRLYNEAILATPAGSLPIRINAQFTKSRKMGKTHQNVLVFVKGDPRRAAANLEALA